MSLSLPYPLLLGMAYAALAALLLTLNLKTAYARPIKLAGIVVVTLFYVFAYHGSQNLRGWAIAESPPNPFKLHWAVIEEPDKTAKTPGAIYLLAQKLSENGALLSYPRLYRLPFSPELADEVEAALTEMEGGKPLEGKLSMKAKNPDAAEEDMQKRDGRESRPDSQGEEDRLKLEFRDLPLPDLPPKTAG